MSGKAPETKPAISCPECGRPAQHERDEGGDYWLCRVGGHEIDPKKVNTPVSDDEVERRDRHDRKLIGGYQQHKSEWKLFELWLAPTAAVSALHRCDRWTFQSLWHHTKHGGVHRFHFMGWSGYFERWSEELMVHRPWLKNTSAGRRAYREALVEAVLRGLVMSTPEISSLCYVRGLSHLTSDWRYLERVWDALIDERQESSASG